MTQKTVRRLFRKKRSWPKLAGFKRMKTIMYKGVKIVMFNNGYYGFRYEYKLYPISQATRHKTKRRGSFTPVINDPSSTNNYHSALWYAKAHADGCNNSKWKWRNL